MSMSKRSVETLLDLVEIKLSSMQVLDREDARELDFDEIKRGMQWCRCFWAWRYSGTLLEFYKWMIHRRR